MESYNTARETMTRKGDEWVSIDGKMARKKDGFDERALAKDLLARKRATSLPTIKETSLFEALIRNPNCVTPTILFQESTIRVEDSLNFITIIFAERAHKTGVEHGNRYHYRWWWFSWPMPGHGLD
eukprot:scaffold13478_cov132-Cylindrotheca_fusiformis.AAC.7